MTTVAEVLERKHAAVRSTGVQSTLRDCAKLMLAHGVGSLIVREDNEFRGIITWHDILRALADDAMDLDQARAGEFMTTDIRAAKPHATIKDVEAEMIANGFRHMPVIQGGEVVGVLSMIDVLAQHLGDEHALVEGLEAYIHGVYPR